jgi:pentatricopeptide repeat domain-containing protein 2
MIRLLEDMKKTGTYPTRRAITFAASLAINQGHPDIGLNIISAASQANYITVRNIKALAYFKVGRIQDALTILRTSVDYESPSGGQKRNILSDVVRKGMIPTFM